MNPYLTQMLEIADKDFKVLITYTHYVRENILQINEKNNKPQWKNLQIVKKTNQK